MTDRDTIRLLGATGAVLAMIGAAVLLPRVAAATPPATRVSTEAVTLEPAPPGLPAPALESLETALGVYEEVRGDLAADRLEAVPARSLRLAGALRLALTGDGELAGAVSRVIEEAARAAESMGQAEDAAAARLAFGEVSRGLLLLAEHDPRLVEGWYAFACPMAEGFEKWLQPTEGIDNPYMGLSMPKCGTTSDWSVEAVSPAAAARSPSTASDTSETERSAREEPVFKPGIPGLSMVDVRDHKFLWREIDELQTWERADRLTIAEFRGKMIEKTAHFLELEEAAASELAAVTSEAVADLRQAFAQRRGIPGQTSGVETLSDDLNAAVARITSVLGEEPRHQLFAPGCKKWLLKLAFGPREAKEAREAAQAQGDSAP